MTEIAVKVAGDLYFEIDTLDNKELTPALVRDGLVNGLYHLSEDLRVVVSYDKDLQPHVIATVPRLSFFGKVDD